MQLYCVYQATAQVQLLPIPSVGVALRINKRPFTGRRCNHLAQSFTQPCSRPLQVSGGTQSPPKPVLIIVRKEICVAKRPKHSTKDPERVSNAKFCSGNVRKVRHAVYKITVLRSHRIHSTVVPVGSEFWHRMIHLHQHQPLALRSV